jgi:hypothetical protein
MRTARVDMTPPGELLEPADASSITGYVCLSFP